MMKRSGLIRLAVCTALLPPVTERTTHSNSSFNAMSNTLRNARIVCDDQDRWKSRLNCSHGHAFIPSHYVPPSEGQTLKELSGTRLQDTRWQGKYLISQCSLNVGASAGLLHQKSYPAVRYPDAIPLANLTGSVSCSWKSLL